jgi:ABC-type antimicrobial peptide transport system permease subunit
LIDMLKQRLNEVLNQHHFVDSADAIDTFEELSALLVNKVNLERQNDYAFLVLGKMNNREDLYIYGINDQLIHSYNVFLWHFREKALSIWSPMFNSVEKFEFVNFQLGSIFFTIIFFLFLIDGILIYSMMLNNVEERTYEFAMLRTLGFKNSSLVTLLVIQACF